MTEEEMVIASFVYGNTHSMSTSIGERRADFIEDFSDFELVHLVVAKFSK
ncbi:hypothetical protein [Solibacillus sp. CAU 1738]